MAALIAGVRERRRLLRRLYGGRVGVALLTLAIVVLGLVATVVVALARRDQIDDEYEARYQLARADTLHSLETGVERYATVLRSAVGLLTASDEVTLDEFVRYGKTLDFATNYPGMESMGFVEPVAWEDQAAFAAELAKDVPGAQVRADGPPHDLALVSRSTSGAERVGLDAASDDNRRAALKRAGDTGEVAMTGPVFRLTDQALPVDERPIAVVLYAPVYDSPVPPQTEQERQALLRGWTGSAFRLDHVVAALGGGGRLVDVAVRVGGASTDDALVGRNRRAIETIELYGQQWQVAFAPTGLLGAPSDEWRSVIWAGASSTLGIAAVIALLATQRARLRRQVDLAVAETEAVNRTLEREAGFQRALLDNLQVGVVSSDAHGNLETFNLDSEGLFAGRLTSTHAGSWSELLGLHTLDGELLPEAENPMWRALSGERVRGEQIIVRPDGAPERVVSCNGQPITDADGHRLGAVVAIHDITELKHAQARLQELATHDPLTGLANRQLLGERIGVALARAAREGDAVAVLFLDLDGFKGVNDRYGHEVGDALLMAVGTRLRTISRATDTPARLGGDEFVILCEGIEPGTSLMSLHGRVTATLEAPYDLPGVPERLRVGVSIGIAWACADDDPAELLRRADHAMYEQKAQRRNGSHPDATLRSAAPDSSPDRPGE